MSKSLSYNSDGASASRKLRRALLVDAGSAARLQPQLSVSGYETRTANVASAPRAIEDFAPHVVLMELRRGGAEGPSRECLALARRLRAEPATYVLPLVLVFDEDERDLRNAALSVGADDYFSVWTPAAEMLARLDALFWRTEAGRRAASVAGDQRLEIDNFILLLDSVRAAMQSNAEEEGTLALVYATPAASGETLDRPARDRTLSEAHGFLKLNLRRVDEVTFYGPTTLLVYLPRTNSETALAALSRLREQFTTERAGCAIAIGLASYPSDGEDVETLIERAEAAAVLARDLSKAERVRAYQAEKTTPAAHAATSIEAAEPPAPRQPAPQQPASQPSPARLPPTDANATRESSTRHAALPLMPLSETTGAARFVERVEEKSGSLAQAGLGQSEVKRVDERPAIERSRVAESGGGTDAAKAALAAGAREMERRASGAIMPRRLLLTVSDAARMAQINALIRSAGYEARAAFDGQQALDLLRIERPDLLLLDYQLQGIDGVETLRRLRKQSGGRLKLPVVMLLPPDHEVERREALELGARDVVIMPYDPAELLISVRLAGNAE